MGLPLRRRRSGGAADFGEVSPTGPVSKVPSYPQLADRLQFRKDVYVILSVPLSQLDAPLATTSPTVGLIAACLAITVSLVSGVWLVLCDSRLRRRQETWCADEEANVIRTRAQLDAARAEIWRLRAERRRLLSNEAKARADYRTDLQQARLDLRTRAERAERQADHYYGELQRLQAEHCHCRPPPLKGETGPSPG
jgi:hypothetical protein